MVVRPIGGGSGGTTIVIPISSTTSTVVSVPAAVVPTVLLAANANRIGFSIRNTSTVDTLYVMSNPTDVVSAALHTVALGPGGYYEDPYHYVGKVTGIWTAATGAALVTEYTP